MTKEEIMALSYGYPAYQTLREFALSRADKPKPKLKATKKADKASKEPKGVREGVKESVSDLIDKLKIGD